jgi:hypothetical protein
MSSSQKSWYAELPYVRATAAIERNYQAVAADMYSLCMKHYKKWVEESKSAKEVVSTSVVSKDTSDYQDGLISAMNKQMITMDKAYNEFVVQFNQRSTPPPKGPPMANVSAASQPTILSMIIIKMAALLRTAGTHMADVGSDAVYRIIAEGLPDLYIELSALIKTSKLKGKRKKAAMDKIREDGKDDELQRLMIKAGFAGFIKIAPKIITDNIPGISVDRLLRELEVNVIASAGTIGGGIVKDLIGPYYDAFLFAESEVKEAVAGIAAASTSGDNTISKIKDVKIEENVPVA